MDAQMEFLRLWANACQTMVEFIMEDAKANGLEHARREHVRRAQMHFERYEHYTTKDDLEQFAIDLTNLAAMYVDMMGRWGVFNSDTDD